MSHLAWSVWLVGTSLVQVEPTPVPTVQSVSRTHAEACRVFPASAPEQPYTLRAEPILRRQQNSVGNSLGYTFLWLEPSGRPAALCDIFFFKNHLETRHMMNEWHSFADAPLSVVGPGAKDQPRDFLKAPGSGLEWEPVPEAPVPAESVAARKLQLNAMARRFSAVIFDSQEQRHELRLLSSPIYAYESANPRRFLAGAIYALCVETDPECLVVLEARPNGTGYRWEYAPVATSIERLFLKLDDTQIWSADPPVFELESAHWKGFIKEVHIPLTVGNPSKS